MNFKRGRAKNRRAGCLLCKPHKANGADRRTLQEQRADQRDHWSFSGQGHATYSGDWPEGA